MGKFYEGLHKNISTECQDFLGILQRDMTLKVAIKWNWFAPTCMNVVKCYIVFSFPPFFLLAFYVFNLFHLLGFIFSHFGFGTEIMNSCIIAFLPWKELTKKIDCCISCIVFYLQCYSIKGTYKYMK